MIATLKRRVATLTADQKFSEILVGSAFAMLAQVAAMGVGIGNSVLISRYYGAEVVGILAMINSFLTLVTIYTVLGTGSSILRLIPEHVAKYSFSSAFRVYRKTQLLVSSVSLVTGTLFFLASGVIAGTVFSKPHLSSFFSLAACFVVFKSLMDLNTQAVRGVRMIRTFAFMRFLPTLSLFVLLVGGVVLTETRYLPIYAQLAAYSLTALVGVWIMDRGFKARMAAGDQVQAMSVREILTISTPMLMTSSLHFFIGQIGVVMLGMFHPEKEVGYYSIAVKLASLTVFVLQAINSMAAPKFSELYHTGKMDELFYVAQKATRLIFWATTPVLLTLVLFGRPILARMFGQDFVASYVPMVMLVIGQFISSISGSTGNFMNMTGHQNPFRTIVFGASLISLVLGLALIPRFGSNGAAFVAMVSVSAWNISTVVFIKKKFGRTIGYLPWVTGS